MPANDPDALYEKWTRWLGPIADETHTLFLYRGYWRGLTEMTQANSKIPPSTFFDVLGVWYSATQATTSSGDSTAILRSVSFDNLLADIAAHPEVMTRERHVELWKVDDDPREIAREAKRQKANANYDRFAGSGNDEEIDPVRTQADLDSLRGHGKPIRDLVNKVIAHSDEQTLEATATYEELNAVIDELGELLTKYGSLL